MSSALLSRSCTCIPRLPALSRALSSSPSTLDASHRRRPSPATAASPDTDWRPHRPARPTTPPTRLSLQKLFAQEREKERLARANPDKPRWRGDARDRLVKSAAALGVDEGAIGRELPQHRERSARFQPRRDGGGAGGPPHRARGGPGAGDGRMVPGRVNHSMRRDKDEQRVSAAPPAQAARPRQPKRPKKKPQALKKVELPSTLRLDNLVNILKERMFVVQKAAERIGLTDTRPDRLLTAEDASLLALELGFDPIIDDEAAFDLFPLPLSPPSQLSPRPPITGIFGHVDHGKTSLLDALRSTSVAAGEAGGITQHIGAFEVGVSSMVANLRARADKTAPPPAQAVKDGDATITFLDTPGHAAFTAMRSRGAGVTDVVVLVVAADDGVKPQTEEVIGLIRAAPDVGVVVALTKVDKPGVDTTKVKQELMAAGIEVEDFGGDVPCVEVSSVTGQGLADLVETISAIAEVRELRAERAGRVEGRVIESRVEKGRGNVATVLVLRGCLRNTASLVAGTTWARVRTLLPPSGKAVLSAYPGQPVEVTGWKDLPAAGDVVLEAASEDEAKRAVDNRLRRIEQEKLWSDVEVINEKQRREAEILAIRKDEEEKAKAKGLRGNAVIHAGDAAVEELVGSAADGPKELLLVIKADVSGTVEAVVGALEGIGNKEAKVKILSSAVGPVTQGDVEMARAVGATIIGFNVKAPGSVMKDAAKGPTPVPIHTSPIIYRLVDTVRAATADLLPKTIETRVHGEATVQMVFEISVKGKKEPKRIAGSKVSNGTFQKVRKARVVRKGEVLHVGTVSTLKQVKKDVLEIQKGVECGIALDDFDQFEADDLIQSIEEVEVARTL
ncbi:translation initiation factor IF-2 [Rhodotorula kratochvilovae]